MRTHYRLKFIKNKLLIVYDFILSTNTFYRLLHLIVRAFSYYALSVYVPAIAVALFNLKCDGNFFLNLRFSLPARAVARALLREVNWDYIKFINRNIKAEVLIARKI